MSHIELLKDCGLKATPQRLCVLKVLGKHTHPTIDELYDDIKQDYPSISLATVYKNLNTLIEQGLVVEVSIPNQKSKFDIYEYPHIHVVCEKCGFVRDFDAKEFAIQECHQSIERAVGNIVKKLNIVATVPDCEHCR
ncbi:Fur family transcriptional regulator [Campylobacter geochelonis]|uniref:FUR family transcriptional regulator n=1 Tax=Campylobacter geochelonis TaxID=1780362 RepID=A0A128EDZ7_9BACT|nr:Fur family transcriptional regulator [Campylobacter geochelonis]QKF70630.1 peroxide stress transcriptional regulator PerR [Campylobacter geochelonis]CZE45897.1 FUR family transcriptional regulator [Campylobacter geochelonis]CZE46741.1 FUR family transcriptional regulator [Campylobacter geochelonis]CZE50327.1 FUR family transcriptional regulator [Campylobacter geochelonis]